MGSRGLATEDRLSCGRDSLIQKNPVAPVFLAGGIFGGIDHPNAAQESFTCDQNWLKKLLCDGWTR